MTLSTPTAGLVRLAGQIIAHFWEHESTEFDGADFQDLMVKEGLAVEATYDPAKHGESTICCEGDPYFEFAPGVRDAITAACQSTAHLGEDHGSGGAGWRPIADAPRDGTRVLVTGPARGRPGWYTHAAIWTSDQGPEDPESYSWGVWPEKPCFWEPAPTHFMPLPPAPDAAAPTAPPPPDGRVEEQTDSPVVTGARHD